MDSFTCGALGSNRPGAQVHAEPWLEGINSAPWVLDSIAIEVRSESLQRLWQVLAAKADSEEILSLPVNSTGQKQHSGLFQQISTKRLCATSQELRESDTARPGTLPGHDVGTRIEEGVETNQIIPDDLEISLNDGLGVSQRESG